VQSCPQDKLQCLPLHGNVVFHCMLHLNANVMGCIMQNDKIFLMQFIKVIFVRQLEFGFVKQLETVIFWDPGSLCLQQKELACLKEQESFYLQKLYLCACNLQQQESVYRKLLEALTLRKQNMICLKWLELLALKKSEDLEFQQMDLLVCLKEDELFVKQVEPVYSKQQELALLLQLVWHRSKQPELVCMKEKELLGSLQQVFNSIEEKKLIYLEQKTLLNKQHHDLICLSRQAISFKKQVEASLIILKQSKLVCWQSQESVHVIKLELLSLQQTKELGLQHLEFLSIKNQKIFSSQLVCFMKRGILSVARVDLVPPIKTSSVCEMRMRLHACNLKQNELVCSNHLEFNNEMQLVIYCIGLACKELELLSSQLQKLFSAGKQGSFCFMVHDLEWLCLQQKELACFELLQLLCLKPLKTYCFKCQVLICLWFICFKQWNFACFKQLCFKIINFTQHGEYLLILWIQQVIISFKKLLMFYVTHQDLKPVFYLDFEDREYIDAKMCKDIGSVYESISRTKVEKMLFCFIVTIILCGATLIYEIDYQLCSPVRVSILTPFFVLPYQCALRSKSVQQADMQFSEKEIVQNALFNLRFQNEYVMHANTPVQTNIQGAFIKRCTQSFCNSHMITHHTDSTIGFTKWSRVIMGSECKFKVL